MTHTPSPPNGPLDHLVTHDQMRLLLAFAEVLRQAAAWSFRQPETGGA